MTINEPLNYWRLWVKNEATWKKSWNQKAMHFFLTTTDDNITGNRTAINVIGNKVNTTL